VIVECGDSLVAFKCKLSNQTARKAKGSRRHNTGKSITKGFSGLPREADWRLIQEMKRDSFGPYSVNRVGYPLQTELGGAKLYRRMIIDKLHLAMQSQQSTHQVLMRKLDVIPSCLLGWLLLYRTQSSQHFTKNFQKIP
jgi:hypothetical protein